MSNNLIPTNLADWTYEKIASLCELGQAEGETHDFKFNIRELKNPNKLCCAFANTRGGFVIVGVREKDRRIFYIEGLEPDREIYSQFVQKLKIEPAIDIAAPKILDIPNSEKKIYIFEIPNSSKKPHIPLQEDDRSFWKRQGPECKRMSLEEVRYQMNRYDEKISKITLMLLDLRQKEIELNKQHKIDGDQYDGYTFSFETLEQCLADCYPLLGKYNKFFYCTEKIISRLRSLNFHKDILKIAITGAFSIEHKRSELQKYRSIASSTSSELSYDFSIIREIIRTEFGIDISGQHQVQ